MRSPQTYRFRLLVLILVFALRTVAAESGRVTFNEHIRPILSANCYKCHGSDAEHREANLRLDTAAGATAERKGVRAIVPGDLENSELWHRVTSPHEDEIMPPPESRRDPLQPEQRELIKRWIQQGAEYQKHWAFAPIARPAVPTIPDGGIERQRDGEKKSVSSRSASLPRSLSTSPATAQHPVDAFVLSRLSARKLTLSPEAPREVLLRRLTLDLTGLPPTTEEIDAYLADRGPDAYGRAVDRLLGSVRYGEHFGRYWLDAVRYADTHGMHLDNVRTIWPYRDWVVQAFNANQRFDQFTIEQIAGDLLPSPRIDQLVATGYNRHQLTTSEAGAIEAEAEARSTADRTDTTAALWLGLTANCASCHDHKFDPLTQREYYSLGAFFKGLADRVWDGNIPRPGPLVWLADATQQQRIEAIAAALPALQSALTARADQVGDIEPVPVNAPVDTGSEAIKPADADAAPAKKPAKAVSYEVVWAEDGDVPTATNYSAPPPPGQWRTGPAVPLAGGERALRLEGKVERPVTFATGEVPILMRSAARAFVHLNCDPANPPRAVSLELIAETKTKRVIWGDPEAFGPEIVKDAIVAGPMPLAGVYTRLELDAATAGLAPKKTYTGLRVAQSGGAAWWDRIGVTCTSPSAADDPLLTKGAWIKALQENVRSMKPVPLPHDIIYLLGVSTTQQNEGEKKRLATFYRDYIYGPTRGALEPEAHAARRLLAEQMHYEMTLPASLIARERAEPDPTHVLVRGQYDKPGERVEPGTPAFLPPLTTPGRRASRLDLARWLVDAKNPLPARVTVNRFWQQLFGAGLVRTPADFGAQGDPPTHPELLDWLADEFMRSGWDVKQLVRLIVTSRTYRQDSRVTPDLLEVDPANKLLARGPRLRLDAEVLRDQALALGGLLRPEVGGPPVRPYQPVNVWEPVAYGGSNTKTYVQDHGAALYRRSVYTFWKRTVPAPSMSTFDAPSRETFCVVRTRSNTPLQALALLNDVQHFEAARALAERILTRTSSEPDRLEHAFRSVTARTPTATERKLLAETLASHRAHFAKNSEAASRVLANGESKPVATLPVGEFAAWTMVANLLLNLDETVTRN